MPTIGLVAPIDAHRNRDSPKNLRDRAGLLVEHRGTYPVWSPWTAQRKQILDVCYRNPSVMWIYQDWKIGSIDHSMAKGRKPDRLSERNPVSY